MAIQDTDLFLVGRNNTSHNISFLRLKDTIGEPYLPLTGGTLTGTLTGQLFKSTRNTGFAFEVKPDNVTSHAYIHTSGKFVLKPTDTGNDTILGVYPTGLDANNGKAAFRVNANGKVKAGHSPSEAFIASEDNDIVTKKYFDNNQSSSANIPVTTSNGTNVGDMWLNPNDNVLYIKKS